MTNASRAKRKRAAVRSAKRSRQNSWWYGLTAIVVIAGIALIVYTQATAPAAVGPFLQNSTGTQKDTHWHAALGVYDCDHWLGDSSGTGIWVWPTATPAGEPARASNSNEYAGLHSHDDGVIHMEPLVSAEAGRNATVGLYFQYGGWKLSATSYSFLGTTVKNGDKCGNAPGTLQWEVATWNGNTAANAKQKYTVMTGNPGKYKLYQYNIVVIAFVPASKTLASLGNPPSLPNLLTAVGATGQTPPTTAAPTPVTTPAPGATTPATTPATTAATTPATATPTSKP